MIEVSCEMIRILRRRKIAFMAAEARICGARETGSVAAIAVQRPVGALEPEGRRMVICNVRPAHRSRRMAGFTFEAKTRLHVAGVDSACVIAHVTTLAGDRGHCVFLRMLAVVTGVAVSNRVHASQRKSFLHVQIEDVLAILPVFRGVAFLAGDPHLSLVGVRVAIGAC